MLLRFKKRRKETVEGFYIKKQRFVLLNGIFEGNYYANQKVFPCF